MLQTSHVYNGTPTGTLNRDLESKTAEGTHSSALPLDECRIALLNDYLKRLNMSSVAQSTGSKSEDLLLVGTEVQHASRKITRREGASRPFWHLLESAKMQSAKRKGS